MANLQRRRAQLEAMIARLTEINRWAEVVEQANSGDTRNLDAYLSAAQAGCVHNVFGNGEETAAMSTTDPDLGVRLAQQQAVYLFISALRAQLREPDKRAEELRAKIAAHEEELRKLADRGQDDLTEH